MDAPTPMSSSSKNGPSKMSPFRIKALIEKLDPIERKILTKSVLICMVFIAGAIPYIIKMMYELFTSNGVSEAFDFVAHVFLFLQMSINPAMILYYELSK